jgi:uridine kinase
MPTEIFCIGISGTSGSGKSMLLRELSARLPDTVSLAFDDYISVSNVPADIVGWLDAGADLNAFQTPQLATNLAALRAGKKVHSPQGQMIAPAPFLLVEEPFGRARRELQGLLDLVVFLDTPMDIALARRVIRTLESGSREATDQLRHVVTDLKAFLQAGRRAYQVAVDEARRTSDIVLDGTLPPQSWIETVSLELQRRGHPALPAAQDFSETVFTHSKEEQRA